MTITVEMALIVSIVSVGFSVFFGLKNAKRTDVKDVEERVKGDTRINVKLDLITSTTAEIKTELSSMREEIKGIDKRLIIVEQSAKSAHKRLDEMQNRLNEREISEHE